MTNSAIILRLYDVIKAGNHDAFRSMCHEDLAWIQMPGFPGGGHHHGADAVIEGVFKKLGQLWASFRFDHDEMHEVADNGVLVIGIYQGTHQSGASFRATTAHFYQLKDGKILRFRQFTDTKLVADAFGV